MTDANKPRLTPEEEVAESWARYRAEMAASVILTRAEAQSIMDARKVNAALFHDNVAKVLGEVLDTLVAKNAAYGDSALDPIRCFSRATPVEQLRVRIDDKLSRLMRGSNAGEDCVLDLIGYLVLLRIAEKR